MRLLVPLPSLRNNRRDAIDRTALMPNPLERNPKLLPRLTAAALIGGACGVMLLAAQLLLPKPQPTVPTDCSASDLGSAIGCLIGGLIADLFVKATLWLLGVVIIALVTSALLGWLCRRYFGVWIGLPAILLGVPSLWILPSVFEPLGLNIDINGPPVIGYAALVYMLLSTLSWPRISLAARLCMGAAIVAAVCTLWAI